LSNVDQLKKYYLNKDFLTTLNLYLKSFKEEEEEDIELKNKGSKYNLKKVESAFFSSKNGSENHDSMKDIKHISSVINLKNQTGDIKKEEIIDEKIEKTELKKVSSESKKEIKKVNSMETKKVKKRNFFSNFSIFKSKSNLKEDNFDLEEIKSEEEIDFRKKEEKKEVKNNFNSVSNSEDVKNDIINFDEKMDKITEDHIE
jgi:hypothetical protein